MSLPEKWICQNFQLVDPNVFDDKVLSLQVDILKIKKTPEKEILWLKLYDVSWEYNEKIALIISDYWKIIKDILPKCVKVKLWLKMVSINITWNVDSILDFKD